MGSFIYVRTTNELELNNIINQVEDLTSGNYQNNNSFAADLLLNLVVISDTSHVTTQQINLIQKKVKHQNKKRISGIGIECAYLDGIENVKHHR